MRSMVDSFLIWWLRSGRYRWSRLSRRLFERRYLATVLPSVGSVEEIEWYLRQVEWTRDGPLHLYDSISYPQATWAKKRDDCDGFATLAAELLRRYDSGYNPVLVTAMVRPVQASHTVCVFTALQGTKWFFDNGSLQYANYQTYEDVVRKISEQSERLVCWDVRNPFTLEMLEFHVV